MDDGEYARLRAALMERVVLGDDVFLGSNPAEIDRFRRFVAKEAPFDIVVDGMNVAYRHCGNKDSHKNKMMQVPFQPTTTSLRQASFFDQLVTIQSLQYRSQYVNHSVQVFSRSFVLTVSPFKT